MPKLKRKLPSYRLHKVSGQAVVTLSGRDHYLGPHGSPESYEEYKRLISEWTAVSRLSPPGPGDGPPRRSDLRICELIAAYCDYAKGYYVKNGQPTGEYDNVQDAIRPLEQLYEQAPIARFGPAALKAVRQHMVEQSLARTVVNSRVNRIRRLFKWGVENELVEPGILHALQAVSPLKRGRCEVRESEPVTPIPEALIDPVLKVVPSQVAAMIRLQLLTGMRPGEVTQMRTANLDTTGKTWSYKPATHKTEHHGRSRVIYLGPQAQDILRPFIKHDLQAFIFSPTDSLKERHRKQRRARKTPLTPSQRARRPKRYPRWKPGRCYDRRSYAWAIRRGCDRAFPPPDGLEGEEKKQWHHEHRWSPNRLRHNAATSLRKRFGLEAARVVLGHSSAAVTEIYAEVDLAKAADIMAHVG